MKKHLLYIGHGHHNKTKSTVFLIDLLATEYEVSRFDLVPQRPEAFDALEKLPIRDFDAIVVFQVMPAVAELRKRISWRHGLFFPMYDYYQGYMTFDCAVWNDYRDFTIVNFSKTLNDRLLKCGFDARYMQYFPKPVEVTEWGDRRSVFFWQRLTKLNLALVAKILANFKLRHLHVHKAMDPGEKFTPPPTDNSLVARFFRRLKLTESTWYETRDGMKADMMASALYMAPRPYEGIGLSFLEAMAAGRCVIAPDCPTMNEYIRHGENGLLYPWDEKADVQNPSAVEIPACGIRGLQQNALEFVRRGYVQWQIDQRKILEWVADDVRNDPETLSATARKYGWVETPIAEQERLSINFLRKITREKRVGWWNPFAPPPDVTVVTVVFNAVKSGRMEQFVQCLDSVQAQTGVRVEHVVVDGASRDGTLKILEDYQNSNHPLRILSKSDKGIYDAMNRGLALANGRYVTFLNSDDYYSDPLGLRDAVARLDETNAEFSYGPIVVLDEDGKPMDHPNCHPDVSHIFVQMEFSHQSVVMRTSAFRAIGGFDLSYRSAADYDSVLRMVFAGYRAVRVERPYVTFRMGGFSCANMVKSQRECGRIYSRLYGKHAAYSMAAEDGFRMYITRYQPIVLREKLLWAVASTFGGVPNGIHSRQDYQDWLPTKSRITFQDQWNVLGLYNAEPWGAWAGREILVFIKLPVDLINSRNILVVDIGAYCITEDAPLVTCRLNGREISKFYCRSIAPERHEVLLEADVLKRADAVLELSTTSTACPNDINRNGDLRSLGVSFHSIEFIAAGDSLVRFESTVYSAVDSRLSGLYAVENWGAWAGRCILANGWMSVELAGKKLVLKMKVGIFHVKDEVPRLDVFFGNRQIDSVALTNIRPEEVTVDLPAELIKPGPFVLELKSSISHCPRAEGLSDDPRELGLSFGGMEIVEAPKLPEETLPIVVEPSDGCVEGLYAPEDWGAWGGERIAVRVTMPASSRGRALKAAITAGSFDCQPIAISVDGTVIAEHTPVKMIPEEPFVCRIPGELTAMGSLDLELSVAEAVVPAERGMSDDLRRLGISFRKMIVSQYAV